MTFPAPLDDHGETTNTNFSTYREDSENTPGYTAVNLQHGYTFVAIIFRLRASSVP